MLAALRGLGGAATTKYLDRETLRIITAGAGDPEGQKIPIDDRLDGTREGLHRAGAIGRGHGGIWALTRTARCLTDDAIVGAVLGDHAHARALLALDDEADAAPLGGDASNRLGAYDFELAGHLLGVAKALPTGVVAHFIKNLALERGHLRFDDPR